MKREDIPRVLKILATCRKAYPSSKADGETLALYVQVLAPLSVAEIEAAVIRIMRTAKFFPSPAEIFEAAESVKRTVGGTGIPDAGEAWEEAMKLVRLYGLYRAWEYSCPQVEKAVERFGRRELCSLQESGVNTARSQFMRIYKEVCERGKADKVNREIVAQMGVRAQELIESAAKEHAMFPKQAKALAEKKGA